MNKLIVLLVVITIIGCSKNYEYVDVKKEITIDTAFSITMQKCPDFNTTCFLVNSNDTMTLEVSWKAINLYYFTDTIHVKKGNQMIYTMNLYYQICPFIYKTI